MAEAQRSCHDIYARWLAPGPWCTIVLEEIIRPFLLGS